MRTDPTSTLSPSPPLAHWSFIDNETTKATRAHDQESETCHPSCHRAGDIVKGHLNICQLSMCSSYRHEQREQRMPHHGGGLIVKALMCKVYRMYKRADEHETTASPKAISPTQPSPPPNYGRRSMMNQAYSCIHIVMNRRDTNHETKRGK